MVSTRERSMQHGLIMQSQHRSVNTVPSSTEADVDVDASDEHVRTVGAVGAMDSDNWVASVLMF